MSRQIRHVMNVVASVLVAANSVHSQERHLLAPTATLGRTGAPVTISVNSTLVLIPVTVTNPAGRPVTDLSRRTFRIFEDDVEQGISSFSRQDGPASIGFILDTSRSMHDRIDRSLAAVEYFLTGGSSRGVARTIPAGDSPAETIGACRWQATGIRQRHA